VEERYLPEGEKKAGKDSPSLTKNNRLRKNFEFNKVFKSGKRKSGEHLTVIYTEREGFKYGITFQRGAKPAVKRNKTKRRIREIIRMTKNIVDSNVHMVIIVSKTGVNLSFKELNKELNTLLLDAEII
jgi:ribonuclease P protein component